MDVNEKTKYKLANSIKTLMASHTLEKITVKQIADGCGLTRQTFYRNFRDKYDLVNWYFEKLCQKSFKQMGVSLTLSEALTRKFEFIREERTFFSQAFQCQEQNSIVAYDYEMILQFYTGIIAKKTGAAPDPDIQFLLSMYCRGSIQMTVEWATGGMKLKPEKIAALLIEAMPKPLEKYLSHLN